ncbi:Adenylate kinase 7, partial [Cladochytrium tenue]
TGLQENLPLLIQEYKDARGLSPIKIVVHGPPAGGKTTLSKALAMHYDLHYLDVDVIVRDNISHLEKLVAASADGRDDDAQGEEVDSAREMLDEIREATSQGNTPAPGYPWQNCPAEIAIGFVRDKLRFGLDSDDEGKDGVDELIMPEYILALECPDDVIKERVMALPESVVAGTKNSEEGVILFSKLYLTLYGALLKRLEEYRAGNTEEVTVLNFFDELEVHPLPIPVGSSKPAQVLESVRTKIGKPHNYGPTPEQIAEKRKAIETQKLPSQRKKDSVGRAKNPRGMRRLSQNG